MEKSKKNLLSATLWLILSIFVGYQLWKAEPPLLVPIVVMLMIIWSVYFRYLVPFLPWAPHPVVFHSSKWWDEEFTPSKLWSRVERINGTVFNHFVGHIFTDTGDSDEMHFWIPVGVQAVCLFPHSRYGYVLREKIGGPGKYKYGKRMWALDIRPGEPNHEIVAR